MNVVVNRRNAIAALGGAALAARKAFGQAAAEKDGGPKAGIAQAARATPLLCCYSQNLAQVFYAELGTFAQQIGYDGVDLTMMEGGSVNPRLANVDVVRALESIRGAALEIPMISTNYTSVSDPTAYPVLAITGHTQVHLFRTGYWPWGPQPNVQRRLSEVRNELMTLMILGQRCNMAAMFPNRAGFVGQAVWDVQTILGDMDPRWVGYYFDPSQATAEGGASGWEIALRLALPRIKAVAVQDFYWAKSGNQWKMQMCPMGEGMVDWALFFKILADAHYAGPLSLHVEYQVQDQLGAQKKDLEFVRKQITQAWPRESSH